MVKPSQCQTGFAADDFKRAHASEQGLVSKADTEGALYQQHSKNPFPLALHSPSSSPRNWAIHSGELHSQSFQPVTISIPMVTSRKWESKSQASLITQSNERNTKPDSHFCDWRTLKERALCRPFWRGFGSERDDSASSQQHWFQALYQTQH